MIDVASNRIGLHTDNESVVNRTRLLFLSDPTSLYNDPEFGLGLKRYIFTYNNPNTVAIIKDRMIEQLNINEPCVDASQTSFADGLLFTEDANHGSAVDYQHLKMTVGLKTIYGDDAEVVFNGD